MEAFIVLFLLCAVTAAAAQVNTDWIKSTLEDHFSQSRHHVSNPEYKLQAKDFILQEFESYGLETHVDTFNTLLPSVKGNNVIGILRGENFKTDKDEVVGLTAHYDTLRDTPGVDASGAAVAVMLQAAKELAKHSRKNTIVFVAFDFLEWEEGVSEIACGSLACGSDHFLSTWVGQYWQNTPYVAGVFVMDVIMNFDETAGSQDIPAGFDQLFPNEVASINSDGRKGDFIAAIGRPFDSTILDAFVTSYSSLDQPEFEIEKFNAAVLSGQYVTEDDFVTYNDLMRSDHSSFWKSGISAIFLTDTGNYRGYMKQCYHSSCDTMEKVTDKMIKFAGKTTEALIGAIDKLASSSGVAAGAVTAVTVTEWIKSTMEDHFSQSRHHVSNPVYKGQAKDFIRQEFESYGLETHVDTFNTLLPSVKGNNVIGILRGENFKTDKDEVVGLTAHYDTLRDTPGVDANGAAVAVMLHAAKELAKHSRKNTIVFVAFDFLEWEEGVSDIACRSLACGSDHFLSTWVGQYWQKTPHVAGVFVMDIIMNFDETAGSQDIPAGFDQLFPNEVASINSDGRKGDFIAAIGRPFDSTILDAFVTSYSSLDQPEFEIEKFNAAVLSGQYVTEDDFVTYNDLMRSDHSSFWKNGISAIFLTDTGNYRGYMKQCYHSSCDTMEKVSDKMIKFAGKTTEALIGAIDKLASSSGVAAGSISVALMTGCLTCVYGILCMNLP